MKERTGAGRGEKGALLNLLSNRLHLLEKKIERTGHKHVAVHRTGEHQPRIYIYYVESI